VVLVQTASFAQNATRTTSVLPAPPSSAVPAHSQEMASGATPAEAQTLPKAHKGDSCLNFALSLKFRPFRFGSHRSVCLNGG